MIRCRFLITHYGACATSIFTVVQKVRNFGKSVRAFVYSDVDSFFRLLTFRKRRKRSLKTNTKKVRNFNLVTLHAFVDLARIARLFYFCSNESTCAQHVELDTIYSCSGMPSDETTHP